MFLCLFVLRSRQTTLCDWGHDWVTTRCMELWEHPLCCTHDSLVNFREWIISRIRKRSITRLSKRVLFPCGGQLSNERATRENRENRILKNTKKTCLYYFCFVLFTGIRGPEEWCWSFYHRGFSGGVGTIFNPNESLWCELFSLNPNIETGNSFQFTSKDNFSRNDPRFRKYKSIINQTKPPLTEEPVFSTFTTT